LNGSLHEVLGEYSPLAHRIRLVEGSDPEKSFKVFAHEMFHALSGRTILRMPLPQGDGTTSEHTHHHQRTGLEIIGGKGKIMFRGLNEAITESLLETIGLVPQSYKRDRRSLEEIKGHMKQSGCSNPTALFYAAYFEDYAVNSKNKIPAWKALDSELRRSLSINYSGFLELEDIW
jgi:hypothetical protein